MSIQILETTTLTKWFVKNKRNFPWRKDINPYFVWISEVMLQQTRANVVIPYFLRWISLFPSIKDLAKAKREKVIKAWEGLGYYSRARNLHIGAMQIQKDFNGKIPSSREDLLKIKGIGLYTSEAILAFGFKKRASPVDGNVLRVLSRLLLIEKDISKISVKKEIQKIEDKLLTIEKPWIVAEALIELGALICKKVPLCDICPMNKNCRALKENKHLNLPVSSRKTSYIKKKRVVFILEHQSSFLMKKVKSGRIMADLYEMPYWDLNGNFSKSKLEKYLQQEYGFTVKLFRKYKNIKQSYTRYLLELFPYHFLVKKKTHIKDWQWKKKNMMKHLPFSSGHRKIIENFIVRREEK